MNKTSISYLTHTWNLIAMRCTPVSPACDYCWHRRMAKRLAANPMLSAEARAAYAGETGPVLLTSRLGEPLGRKKPAIIGVQFMGDLFHDDVPESFIWAAVQTMFDAPQHTFLVLTKRPARMLDVLTKSAWWNNDTPENIWLGVTVENQAAADERREYLEDVPAAIKFVSYEPALRAVDWTGWEFLDLLISGGETGPGARPSHPQWFRDARDFCQANGVTFHFKQWGEWIHQRAVPLKWTEVTFMDAGGNKLEPSNGNEFWRVGNKRAGHFLDGKAHREMPEVTK